MTRTTTATTLLALALSCVVAFAVHGCGGSNDNRQRERCETCNPADIDHDCVEQCLRFCAPGEADCQGRCNRQCDECKSELECRTCATDCTGTTTRCAPVGEPLVCEDGTF